MIDHLKHFVLFHLPSLTFLTFRPEMKRYRDSNLGANNTEVNREHMEDG